MPSRAAAFQKPGQKPASPRGWAPASAGPRRPPWAEVAPSPAPLRARPALPPCIWPEAAGSANVNIPPEIANSEAPIAGLREGTEWTQRDANAQGRERWDERGGQHPPCRRRPGAPAPSPHQTPRARTPGRGRARPRLRVAPPGARQSRRKLAERGPRAAGGRQAAWGAAGCAWTPGAEDARGAAQESRPRLPGF